MKGRVALLPTCVVDTIAPQVGVAAVSVLRHLGYEVSVPKDATCCGQPGWNAGFAEEAAMVAKTTLDALEADPADVICLPAGSCTTMIRIFWPELFELVGDHDAFERARELGPRVREFSELVAKHTERIQGRFASKVAYHHSCHMLRELRIRDQPAAVLSRLEGCAIVEWAGDERCCGFGGLFSVKQPETSVAMADEKVEGIRSSGAEVLVGCDSSCLLHLEGRLKKLGHNMPVKHLAEVLQEAGPETPAGG